MGSVPEMMKLTRYAWLSFAASVCTVAFKAVAWALTDSVGLLSDALESLVNVGAAVMLLSMLRIAPRPADKGHAYGQTKAESSMCSTNFALEGSAFTRRGPGALELGDLPRSTDWFRAPGRCGRVTICWRRSSATSHNASPASPATRISSLWRTRLRIATRDSNVSEGRTPFEHRLHRPQTIICTLMRLAVARMLASRNWCPRGDSNTRWQFRKPLAVSEVLDISTAASGRAGPRRARTAAAASETAERSTVCEGLELAK